WTKTSQTITTPYPYGYIKNNDMLPGNIMPLCNTGLPYKSYSNCSTSTLGMQTCDIARECFPGSSGTATQSQVVVPIYVMQGADQAVNSGASDSINSAANCSKIGNDVASGSSLIQSSYCIPDVKDPGCVTCNRPVFSGTLLSLNTASQVGHNCTATTNNNFYCDATTYIACQTQTPNNDINFTSNPSDVVKICDVSSFNPNPSTRISSSNITNSSIYQMSTCTVNRSCAYNSYTAPTNTNNTPIQNANNAINNINNANSNVSIVQKCVNTYDWPNGLIYQLVTFITRNLSIIVLFYIAIILYITVIGFKIIMGLESISIKGLSEQIISIALVLMFCSPLSWNYYQHFIIEFYVRFTEGLNTLIAGIVMPQDTNSGTNLFGPLDQVLDATFLNRTVWIRASALLFSFWYGWIIFIIIVASMFLYMITAVKAFAMYISTIIMSSFWFCLGPIFFLMLMFKETKQYFDTWKNTIIGMIASQAYLFSAMAIFSVLYLGAIDGLLYFKVCFKSIITLPVINVTILGWWKVASNALPEAIAFQIGNVNGLLQTYDNSIPSASKVILLLLIVALMEKFIQSPLVGGKGGMELGDAVSPYLDMASGAVRGAAVSGIMAPVAMAEGLVSKIPGGDILVNRMGIGTQGSKALLGQGISTSDISKGSDNKPNRLLTYLATDKGKNPASDSSGGGDPNPQPNPSPGSSGSPSIPKDDRGLAERLGSGLGKTLKTLNDTPGNIKNAANDAWTSVKNAPQNIANSAKNTANNALNAVKNAPQNIANSAKNFANDTVERVKNAPNEFKNAVERKIDNFGNEIGKTMDGFDKKINKASNWVDKNLDPSKIKDGMNKGFYGENNDDEGRI
ncbi:MAG: hypothetical protein EBZ58_11710, partial [Bacteroidetes bacterium]|nr:hypothetical protein [Bacteroidota bacterium]